MRTFIINLERCHERRIHMENVLRDANIEEFEFFTGIDGKAND